MDIATGKSDPGRQGEARRLRPRLGLGGSRLGRLIIGLNLLGLLVLIVGALVLNEFRRGLVDARIDSLTTQGELLSDVIVRGATVGEPEPAMGTEEAREILQLLAIPRSERARLYNADGQIIADTDVIADKVVERSLPPVRKPGQLMLDLPWNGYFSESAREARAHAQETAEMRAALAGRRIAEVRPSETGGKLVSVSIPIQHVKTVLGVLTIEAGDVDRIVAAQRAALLPFILIAIATIIGSSLLLNGLVAEPVRRLARAADRVRLSRAREISLPDISARQDEVGDLARALESMTSTMSARMDAIERFAADVSHEIKNPLTSMRSALETLDMTAPGSPAREKLAAILKQDVRRLDRLITDIANASRMDAELSRDQPKAVDLGRFLSDIVSLYPSREAAEDVGVQVVAPKGEPLLVRGREGPLGQVFRNLIDNARSFSPPGGDVRVVLRRERTDTDRLVAVTVEDDGPGLPPENLESVFQRFYTNRPKGHAPGGSAFGGHSGLGLSIVQQIVEAHGGRVHAENRTDASGAVLGARFVVTLPEPRVEARVRSEARA
ncbi:MAG: stimulus-sensing domain-containing protein [Caulobacteraceae bacterium]